ncbi:MAG: nickel/cobalt transporter [Pseudorhodoplanes sp.]|nr:nickel/cobalt transporter [Pseudorhodoplanes sp.]
MMVLFAASGLDAALAQAGPFGVGRPPAASAPPDGIVGWIIAKQAEFYRGLSGAVRAAKSDGSAVWGLLTLSFLYGIFHAAGPGHGKAVISSYLVANEETWKRGIVLSFASAFLQALVAVSIVGVAAVLLGATARTMNQAVRWIELISYGLIALIGLRLTYVKGRAFLAALRGEDDQHHGHAHHHDHAHDHAGHGHGAHAHDHAHRHDHAHKHHDHAHAHRAHDDHAGHSHGPEPAELAGPGGWKRGLTAIVAVGLRPCSGAILVLVFALAQGLFWAGVASTFVMGLGTAITVAAIATLAVGAKSLARRIAASRTDRAGVFVRGLEVAAAILVFVFGIALLAGYMASERMFT